MTDNTKLNRREFLGKTALLSSTLTLASGAKKVSSQLNNAAIPYPERIGVGVIGVGVRGTELLQASQKISGIEIIAGCDLYKGHLERARELTGGEIITTNKYEELLARKDIDAVVIAVPDHWHKKVIIDSLAAGKHVYIEKPLTHKIEEGDEIVRAVEESGRVVQVGSQTLSAGCAEKARELIDSGRLGKITMIEAKMLRYSSLAACYYPIPPDASPETVDWQKFIGNATKREFDPKRFFQWRLFWDYSGGLSTDLFVHLVSITHYLMGVQEPESVTGFSDKYYWKNYREVPDQITALVSYPQGFVLKLTTSVNNGHPEPMMVIYGTKGTLEYDGSKMKFFSEPPQESFGYATNSWPGETVEQFKQLMNLDENQRPISGQPPIASEAMEFHAAEGHNTDIEHLRNFYNAIRSGSEVIENIQFGANAVRVGHMINLACRKGKVVRWNARERKIEA